MRSQFICKLVGSFKYGVLIFFIFSQTCLAASVEKSSYLKYNLNTSANTNEKEWQKYIALSQKNIETDKTNGISYIISGGLALVGGLTGAGTTSDPLEKGIYALFETIGIASIGYGAYKWKVGDEDRLMYLSLDHAQDLTHSQKINFLNTYYDEKKIIKKQERYIKAITHGMIAALNFYNASKQTQSGVKNSLFFVGGANLLASLSYSF